MRTLTCRFIDTQPARRLSMWVLLAALLGSGPASAQSSFDPRNRQPAATPSLQQRQVGSALNLPAPDITAWRVIERPGITDSGRPGETIRIEGRTLDADALLLETRFGGRSIRFPRKAGGSAGRVEFTIPPDAITGDLMVVLQASTPGSAAKVLSERFGVCDGPRIHSIEPDSIGYNPKHLDKDGHPLLNRKPITLRGACLRDLRFERLGAQKIFDVGRGRLVVGGTRSQAFGEIVLELDRFIPPPDGNRAEGRVRLLAPTFGPAVVVEDAFTQAARRAAGGP